MNTGTCRTRHLRAWQSKDLRVSTSLQKLTPGHTRIVVISFATQLTDLHRHSKDLRVSTSPQNLTTQNMSVQNACFGNDSCLADQVASRTTRWDQLQLKKGRNSKDLRGFTSQKLTTQNHVNSECLFRQCSMLNCPGCQPHHTLGPA